MKATSSGLGVLGIGCLLASFAAPVSAEETAPAPKAFLDGEGPGWVAITGDDFEHVNGEADTWTWDGGFAKCTGKPVGVTRTKKQYTNFEMVVQWRHLESGGNSGVFVWAPESAFEGIVPGRLPKGGIEVQILDHGYLEKYEKRTGKKAENPFFSTNGDVFPVGTSKMKPFEPTSPNGSRSFPRKNLSKGTPEWNHYYIRAINGEVRLWVNGEEVSGGTNCEPRSGYLCLESEGAPVEFRGIRIRELP
jgi:hypothetical protein